MGGQEAYLIPLKTVWDCIWCDDQIPWRISFCIGDYKQAATVFFGFTKALESVTNNIKNNTYLFSTINAIGKMVGQTFLTFRMDFQ